MNLYMKVILWIIKGREVNNKREGIGEYIYENGDYYIGQFVNDIIHGKGKDYYENGLLMYEGDFLNDQWEGFGKFINENGIILLGNL